MEVARPTKDDGFHIGDGFDALIEGVQGKGPTGSHKETPVSGQAKVVVTEVLLDLDLGVRNDALHGLALLVVEGTLCDVGE